MTIFLTTQYLEEADALADRVGIIDGGRIVAEGTPTELKRSVGADVIVVRVDGDADAACDALGRVPGVLGVEAHGHEAGHRRPTNGAATIERRRGRARPRATIEVRDLTLRTPTLDDVFLELTGNRIAQEDQASARPLPTTAPTCRRSTHERREPHHRRRLARRARPRPAGFVADITAIAGRALRAVPRDLEAVIPPIFIALFFFLVNIGTLQNLTESSIPGLRLQGVPAADGDPARRHRRLAGAGAGARRAERLLRPAAAHARCGAPRSCSGTWWPTSPSPSVSSCRS